MRELRQLLRSATAEERQSLASLLEAEGYAVPKIVDAFWWNCQSIFGWVLGAEPEYHEIVRQVADKLGVSYSESDSSAELEIRIAQSVMRSLWDRMDEQQRKQMEAKLRQMAKEFDGSALLKSGSVFVALTSAHLSGFGVYLLASTALGAVSGAVGLVLPFAVYTTMSGAIAAIIGPPGWIAAGLFAVWKLTGPNFKRLIPAVIYVSALRSSGTVARPKAWRMVGRCGGACGKEQSYDLSHCNEPYGEVVLRSEDDHPTISGTAHCDLCGESIVLPMPTHCGAPVQELRLLPIY